MCLAIYFPVQVFAGGVLVCDNYGHMCVQPGIGCGLIPPVYECSIGEMNEFISLREKDVGRLEESLNFGSKAGTFTLKRTSRNNDYQCVGGLEAAQTRANELCQSKAITRINNRQCLVVYWIPTLNIEILQVHYRCNRTTH